MYEYDKYSGTKLLEKYYYGDIREAVGAPLHDYWGSMAYISMLNVKGMFVGHDHLNDLSVSYNGIRYTYGQCIDYVAYAGDYDNRGGTLITLHKDNTWDVNQVLLKNL